MTISLYNRQQRTPASKNIVKNLPCIRFCESETQESGVECSVCKEEFKQNDLMKQMPCKHQFHSECLDPWLADVHIFHYISLYFMDFSYILWIFHYISLIINNGFIEISIILAQFVDLPCL